MTDGQSLFAILILLYLSDCLAWVPRQGVLFVAEAGSYAYRLPGQLAGNLKGAIIRLNPFPPFRPVYETRPLPFSISEEGICAWVSSAIAPLGRPPQSGVMFRFEDIDTIDCHGAELRINGAPFAAFHTTTTANRAAQWIRTLQDLPPAARAARLDEDIAQSLATEPVEQRIAAVHQVVRWIHPLTHAFFYILLIIAPLVCWKWGVNRMLIPVALALFACILVLNTLFVRAHRTLYPEERGERWLRAFILCVSWPMSVRLATDLGRHALAGVHPLGAARVLLPEAAYDELAGRMVRDALHPLPAEELDDDQRRIESAHRERIARLVTAAGTGTDVWTRAPQLNPEETRYCPRCHTGYLDTAETCIECFHLPLESRHE